MSAVIQAMRKDGTPVQIGDRVLAVWDNGDKQFGDITAILAPMRFTSKNNAHLQCYTIRGGDGQGRPAHAWHIKYTKGA